MKASRYNLALIVANALFALNFSLFVSVLEGASLGIGVIFMLQNLVLLLVMALWSLVGGWGSVRVTLSDGFRLALISLLSSFGWSYVMLWGISLSSPIDAATIASAGPSLTLIFAHFMGRRRLTSVRLCGVALSLLGVLILTLGHVGHVEKGQIIGGNLLLIFAVVVAALNTLILKPYLARYGVARVAWRYALASVVASVPLFWGQFDIGALIEMSHVRLFEVGLMLLLGGAVPLLLLFDGTEYLSPLHTSLYRYLQPFVTSAVVVCRGQARLSMANYIAFVVIVVGCILVARGVDRTS